MSRLSRAVAAVAGAVLALGMEMPALAATSYPNDYFFVTGDDQWALTGSAASINAPAAWCASTGENIVVADVDSGANFSHPDLQGKLIAGVSFLGGTSYPNDETHPTGSGPAAVSDDFFHGTMTTGIIVADTDNGQGMAAVAPDAKALVIKVFDSKGQGYASDVANGIRWAVDYGKANVINLSIEPGDILGTGVVAPAVAGDPVVDAIQYAYSHNVAVALAAGNQHFKTSDYVLLVNNQQALIVGALGPGDTVASYSNFGYGVSIYAPGGDAPQNSATPHNWIVSTSIQSNGYIYEIAEGTSFATPQVAGVLALLMARGDSAQQAIAAVLGSAATSADGHHQLDAAAALGRPRTALCGTPSTAGTVAPKGFAGSPPPTQPPHTQAPSTAAPRTQAPQTSTTTTSTAPASPGVSAMAGGNLASGDAGVGGAGHSGQLPPATAPAPGGSPLPAVLVLAAVAALVIGGAPVGRRVLRVLRRPR